MHQFITNRQGFEDSLFSIYIDYENLHPLMHSRDKVTLRSYLLRVNFWAEDFCAKLQLCSSKGK